MPPNRRQLIEVGLYVAIILSSTYFLYREFIRYLLSDFELIAMYVINPHPVVSVMLIGLTVLLTTLAVQKLRRLSKPPVGLFRLLKGGFGFSLLFWASFGIFHTINIDWQAYWNEAFYKSKHRFVVVTADNVTIRRNPSIKSPAVSISNKNELFIHMNTVKRKRLSFAKVLIRHERFNHGYILERAPPRIGVPAFDLVEKRRLNFRYYHLYSIALGIAGFVFGAVSFRMKPL